MKKRILILISVILLWFSFVNADFSSNSSIAEKKQELFKKEIQKIYDKFEVTLSRLEKEKQVDNLKKISSKIDENLKNQKLNENNIFVLSYLQFLVKEKIEVLEAVNVWDILQIENEYLNDIQCNSWYLLVNWECIKQVESNSSNTNTTKECYIDNGKGIQTYNNWSWSDCEITNCDSSYHREWTKCVENKKDCSINNWTCVQYWNNWSWLEKEIICNHGYELDWTNCIKKCASWTWKYNGECVSQKPCDIENWYWLSFWYDRIGSFWVCNIQLCKPWYNRVKNEKTWWDICIPE